MTIGILDDKALPIIEIKPSAEFFNYEAKYQDNKTEYLVVEQEPKDSTITHEKLVCRTGALPQNLYAKAQKLAEDAHRVLGCKGFSRVDMLMSEKGDFYLLEVNTIPGFTEKVYCLRRRTRLAYRSHRYAGKLQSLQPGTSL